MRFPILLMLTAMLGACSGEVGAQTDKTVMNDRIALSPVCLLASYISSIHQIAKES